ncbi:HdeA/HdeB family chaperone [Citrobacter braakii]|uniref:HdeA/HdeB family chaperone n=1 Tax=Citrobacter braakii TaxID=57706 RepID=UPI00190656AD|nr:ABC transporter substrate-binding protein [Citrobacter braakii]
MLLLERIVNIKLIVSAAILMTSVMVPMRRAFATQATEAAPQDMTCKEFVDMSRQYMTAIAFVIVNKNSDFKGDDYVPLHEVETVAVPKMIKMCHRHPDTKLGELAVNLKGSGLHY